MISPGILKTTFTVWADAVARASPALPLLLLSGVTARTRLTSSKSWRRLVKKYLESSVQCQTGMRNSKNSADLIKILEEAGQEVPRELSSMSDRYEKFKEREAEAKAAFGGRNFGGGGGGGRGCFNCGEEGHMSRECP